MKPTYPYPWLMVGVGFVAWVVFLAWLSGAL